MKLKVKQQNMDGDSLRRPSSSNDQQSGETSGSQNGGTNGSQNGGTNGSQSGGTSGIDINTGDLSDIYGGQDGTYNTIGGRIIGVVSYLCYGAAVIVLITKGVQFMQKAPEAKAEAKKELVSYAIGAFILFGIGGIIRIIGEIAKNSLF